MKNIPGKVLALVVGLFITIIGCLTVLVALDKDPAALISISVSALLPSLISLVTLGHVSDVKHDVGVVQKQTNGHMTAALAAAGIPPVELAVGEDSIDLQSSEREIGTDNE